VVDAKGFRVHTLAVDPRAYRMAYDVVSNATLWFLHHGLFDLSRRPRLDRRWAEAWAAYRDVNHAFARAVIDQADEGAVVLVQD
jgi:trehalose 6-phosphate synthase